MDHLDVRRLGLLRTVAELGSLTAAAHATGYTTSAISQQVAKLEREAGVPLVERHARGVHLTEAGQVLVRHATRIDEALHAARRDMDEFRGLRRGRLDIGTFPTAGASLLPGVVVALRRRHPDVEIAIASARLDGLLASLRRHDIDLALLWDYAWSPLREDDLMVESLMDDPTVLLLPADHRLAALPEVDLADLADEDWVVRAEHPVSSILERVCTAAGFVPRVVLAANDYPEVQGMVAARLGVSLAPRLAVLTPREGVVARPLAGNPAPRRILLARLANRRPSAAAQAAIPVFRECAREL